MATAPPAAAMAKAPPPEVLRMYAQDFPNLADIIAYTPRESEAGSAPQSQHGSGSIVWSARENSESIHSEAQGNGHTSSQALPEPPLTESQGTLQIVSRAPPTTPQPRPLNPWETISDAPNPPSNPPSTQHRSGDYRLLPDGSLRPQPVRIPKINLWASRRFDQAMPTEEAFLKLWLLALQDHDFGTQRVWRDYCRGRSDGTFDPRNHTPSFVRRFLFVYGSQPPNFFTQHQDVGLLTEEQEHNILGQFADVYQATHWHNNPPHRSMHWPPLPVPAPATPLAAPAAQQREVPPDRHVTEHHHSVQRLPQHTPPAGWPQPSATPVQAAAWYSNTTNTYNNWHHTPQWNLWLGHWSSGWDWHSHAGWGGDWRWS